jgi:hypothetical protein
MKYLKSTLLLMIMCFSSVFVMAQNESLIHRYRFDGNLDDEIDDSNGVVVTELSPGTLTFMEGYDGTPDGAINFVDGDGLNYMIYVGRWSAAQEGAPDELTVTFWAYWHGTTGSFQDIINKRDNYDDDMLWGINQHSSTGDVLSVHRRDMNCNSSKGIPQEVWTHVAIGMDGTNAYFYMDGEKYDEQPYTYREDGSGYDARIHMGCAVNSDYVWRSADPYNGALDDVRFYSRLLDDDEISDIYNNVGIDDKSASELVLTHNYPNPFKSSTTIRYVLTRNTRTEIIVYDLLGHKLATLVDEYREAGTHRVAWDASGLPAGVYVYRFKTDDLIVSKKMKLIK